VQKHEKAGMLVVERRETLLKRLRADGKLIAKDLALELGISDDSIRRDLRDLAAAGLCQRVYGGALPASPALADYRSRMTVESESKQHVAALAASLIKPGSRVILDGGTTTLAVVNALAPTLTATVITHSPTIAAALVEHPRIDVFLIGGQLFKHSAVTCGAAAVEAACSISADLFLLGVTGVHPAQGLTTGDVEEAAMKRLLASRAAETYALASREKLGAASPFKLLALEQIAGLIFDSPAANPVISELASSGIQMLDATPREVDRPA
jgi:DeoR/GlpR family transcriptional regulator of sugar metabolism